MREKVMRLNGGAGFAACGPAFQWVQPAGRPAPGRIAPRVPRKEEVQLAVW